MVSRIFQSRDDIVRANDPELLSIFDELVQASGRQPDKQSHQANILYGTYHHPKFTFLDNHITRNTLVRLSEFSIPERLDDIEFFDIGCNLGHISIELARRGAHVKAFDCVPERLRAFRRLVRYLDLESHIEIYCVDFNRISPEQFISLYGPTDFTVCFSVDKYITNVSAFYHLLSMVTNEYCYLESNTDTDESPLLAKEFQRISYLGNSSALGFTRRLYKAENTLPYTPNPLLKLRTIRRMYLRKDGWLVIHDSHFSFPALKRLLPRLQHPYIAPTKVQYGRRLTLIVPGIQIGMYSMNGPRVLLLTPSERQLAKKQILDVLAFLHAKNVKHGDFISPNILWSCVLQHIWVIDWEYLDEDEFLPVRSSYDISEQSRQSLLKCDHPGLTLGAVLGISEEDLQSISKPQQ